MGRALALLAGLALVGVAAVFASRSPMQSPGASTTQPGTPPPRWDGKSKSKFVKPPDADLKARLTPLQYEVTQNDGTERAFANPYNAEKRPGIYVDIVSGEPLFSSLEKFDSGTGWPSFWKPLEPGNVKQGPNLPGIGTWAEVRSAHADSHLGHVFSDGPPPTGLRYCMNSAAMWFIPAEELEAKGYGQYAKLFAKKP